MEVKGIEQTSGNSIKAVSFSFFTSEQQRLLSVKQVTRSVTFDRLGRPQRDGLYDAALGPLDPLERCETCSLSYEDCPGHYGHIELALPTFHPLLFNELHKLLKCCCFECRTLRLGKDEKAYFVRVLKTLREGKACEAGNQLATDSLVIDEATNTGEMFLVAGPVEAVSSGDGDWSHKFVNKTCHQQELWAKTIAEIAAATPKKCSRCDAMSCTLKKDGYLRILKKPLPKRNRADNPTPSKAKKPKAQSKKEKKPDPMLSSDDDDDDDDDGDIEDDAEKEEDDEDDEDEDAIMGSSVKDRGAARAPKGELPINITPLKALHLLRSAFKKDKELMELMFGVCKDGGLEAHASLFFLQTLLVPPNRFRPPIHLGDSQFEHPYNVHLKGVMQENEQVLQLLDKKGSGEADEDSDEMDSDVLMKKWMAMQAHVNEMIDSSKAEKKNAEGKGVRQELERKEGLMRMNMMGKRVNFACRSVISPDPFMNTDQVGIPEVFARKLSWPEPVNQYNARKLRQAVVNGPSAWPGANYVIDERGFKIDLSKKPLAMRSALAKQLERVGAGGVPCKVGRHLQDGDWVLVNRQPTLHKVSLMAHRVKVNRGQRVIRMHYANCKSYNADFDGDEINVHFPQDQLGRAEASELVHTDQQYIVPTDGSPVRGLIQDHIIGGVQLCQLNRFFRREEYQELVFLCFANLAADLELPNNTIKTVPPTIWKPVPLWTGKQIITTILHNLLHGDPPLNMSGACKVKGNMYNQHTHEGTLIVRGNDMLSGVLDKSHIGASANGLVHAVFEAHGPHKAGLLLTIFGRLFTHFMQVHRAFTCGVLDLMVTPDADQKRRDVLATSNWRTLSSSANFAEIEFGDDCSKVKGRELERRRKAVHKALAHLLHEEKGRKLNDGRIQQALASVTSGVIDSILPTGQMVPFPENNFEMMTATGAKGSKVNMSQICCLLGQQQLEGQRVPVMASGKTLPSFREWETDARAGGFVADRFLTGIRPQEYFFHCMAGREGLVDTAVKTSRSGYLQRCLMKHLESLTVAYDRSVRDCDGGVAQFLYGEDGIDPVKQLGLRWLPLLADNSAAVARSISPAVLESMDRNAYREHVKKVKKDAKTHDLSYKQARLLHKPLTSLGNADLMMGYVSEAYEDYIEDFMEKMVKGEIAKPEKTSVATLRQLAFLKYARSMVHPGEAVGAVAAQSVGEPSTQMTLNTFHSAGQGNATAGIPRLRELIMTASKKPANPTMTLRLVEGAGKGKEGGSREAAESVAQELSRVCVAELISGVEVKDCIARGKNGGYARRYEVKVGLEKEEMLPAGLKKSKSARAALGGVLKGRFVLRVLLAVEKEIKSDAKSRGLDITEAASERRRAEPTEEEEEKEEGGKANDDADGESSEGEVEEEEGEEGGAKAEAKRRDKKGYSEAEKADKKAVRKGAEKPGAADDDEDDEDDDEEGDEVMEEKEEPEWSEEAITLVPYTLREQSRLKIMKDKYHVSVNLEDGGKKGGGQLTFSLTVGAGMKRVMLVQLVEDEAAKCVVQELQGIDKCHVLEPSKKAGGDKECSILTEGVNLDLLSLWRVNHHKTVAGILDLNKVRCNDIAQIRRVYGVEAARRALLEEIGGVFKAYGIGVDNRHLTLISDTMMYAGDHRPLNRIGINHNSSPLLKMSFETTCKFLTDASLSAEEDLLTSPSSRLIVGRPVATGTGFFDVRQKLLAGKARKA